MIEIPKVGEGFNLENYFIKHDMADIVSNSSQPMLGVNDMITENPYKPELKDLYRLHRFVIDLRRTTVLEFGVGWSTLVFANALNSNANIYGTEIGNLRRNNPFELHSVDNESDFIDVARNRLPSELQKYVFFHHSNVEMSEFNGRICTRYETLPLVNPDLIYLDGPDQFNVRGEVAGWSTRHKDMMPMSCDILRIEHFLTPGTLIVVDGRAANARFLKTNLQRDWDYKYDEEYDQHLFLLCEPPLGKYNYRQLEFYGSQFLKSSCL
ncbi:MAG: hypothetical protein AAFO04_10210 [Cyanobacteria bacterium J06592_8]